MSKTLREAVDAMTDDQLAELMARADAHQETAAELARVREREKGSRLDRHAVAKRVRNALLAQCGERYAQAKRSNDRQQSPEGDARVVALGLLRREMSELEVRDFEPDPAAPDDTELASK